MHIFHVKIHPIKYNNIIEEELSQTFYMTQFCKIDISML